MCRFVHGLGYIYTHIFAYHGNELRVRGPSMRWAVSSHAPPVVGNTRTLTYSSETHWSLRPNSTMRPRSTQVHEEKGHEAEEKGPRLMEKGARLRETVPRSWLREGTSCFDLIQIGVDHRKDKLLRSYSILYASLNLPSPTFFSTYGLLVLIKLPSSDLFGLDQTPPFLMKEEASWNCVV